MRPLFSPIRATCPAPLILLDFITHTILGEVWEMLGYVYGKRFGSKIAWANRKEGDRVGAGPRWNRECFETSAYKIQTPGNYPEGSIQHSEHGESLKSRLLLLILNSVLNSAHDLSSCNVLNRPTCIHACIRTLMCLWEYSLIYIKIVRHVLQDWRSFFQEVQAFCVVTQSSRVIYSWDFEAIIFRGSGIGLIKTFGLWPPTVLSTALLHCVITR